MIDGSTLVRDALVAGIALAGGYAIGSIPVAAWLGRRAGAGATGAGWRLLTLTGDLAKGTVPVAIGLVSWSWTAAWVAGMGVVIGACWPAFGRFPGGRGVTTLGGTAIALAPAAGIIAGLVALLAAGVARLVQRGAQVPATAAGLGAWVVLIAVVEQDLGRLGAALVLVLVVGFRIVLGDRSGRAPQP